MRLAEDRSHLDPHTLELLIAPELVDTRVVEMGLRVMNDFWKNKPVMLAVKKGGLEFNRKVTDVLRDNKFDFTSGSVGVSSYGRGTESNRKPTITEELDVDVEGQNVIVDEDIIDTGHTINFLLKHLYTKGAKRVAVNTLLWKPDREIIKVPIYQYGFKIPDKFVVGEGIDWSECYRTLSGIFVVNMLADANVALA